MDNNKEKNWCAMLDQGVWLLVISFMDSRSLVNVSMTCREMLRTASLDEKVWKRAALCSFPHLKQTGDCSSYHWDWRKLVMDQNSLDSSAVIDVTFFHILDNVYRRRSLPVYLGGFSFYIIIDPFGDPYSENGHSGMSAYVACNGDNNKMDWYCTTTFTITVESSSTTEKYSYKCRNKRFAKNGLHSWGVHNIVPLPVMQDPSSSVVHHQNNQSIRVTATVYLKTLQVSVWDTPNPLEQDPVMVLPRVPFFTPIKELVKMVQDKLGNKNDQIWALGQCDNSDIIRPIFKIHPSTTDDDDPRFPADCFFYEGFRLYTLKDDLPLLPSNKIAVIRWYHSEEECVRTWGIACIKDARQAMESAKGPCNMFVETKNANGLARVHSANGDPENNHHLVFAPKGVSEDDINAVYDKAYDQTLQCLYSLKTKDILTAVDVIKAAEKLGLCGEFVYSALYNAEYGGPRWLLRKLLQGYHVGYCCDQCGVQDFLGVRYECDQCEDYHLCEKCKRKGVHEPCRYNYVDQSWVYKVYYDGHDHQTHTFHAVSYDWNIVVSKHGHLPDC